MILGLILLHLLAGRLRFLNRATQNVWLSFAAGTSVAFVFLHLFPEMQDAQEQIVLDKGTGAFTGRFVYLIALASLVLFYGLDRLVKANQSTAGREAGKTDGETTTAMGVYWLHMISFTLYNALIGYLLVYRKGEDVQRDLFFLLAMALHFMVNDYSLCNDHRHTYQRVGRWLLSAAIGAGWLTGWLTTINEAWVNGLFAFLAGGVVLNVLKEELPESRQSRFVPFLIGVVIYSGLLLLL
jgi:zinc transporter ZupT